MVLYVLDALAHHDVVATVVVVGHAGPWVEASLKQRARNDAHLTFVEQAEQLGTGHAVSVAMSTVANEVGDTDGDVLIVPGDTPLLRHATIGQLLDHHRTSGAALTVLSAELDNPSGYGRIVRAKDGSIATIVEERDATDDERAIHEVNTSIMVVRESLLGPALRLIGRQNSQNEYYLTDLVAALHNAGHVTSAMVCEDPAEAAGVNDRAQLADAEAVLRRRINQQWMMSGVTMWDPSHTYVDADVLIEPDVSLLPGTVLKGRCEIERGAQVGPNAFLTDTYVGEGAVVGSVEALGAYVGEGARVGSFVVLAPGAKVGPGEFVAPFQHL
jgi:bifunctional UDP-N-acetylglucosamine pyrophosphorylase/glucosamine-1-phosphate N-acetyltransferase